MTSFNKTNFTNEEINKVNNLTFITGKINSIKIITAHNNKIIISGKITTPELIKINGATECVFQEYNLLFDECLLNEIKHINDCKLVTIKANMKFQYWSDPIGIPQKDIVLFVSKIKHLEPTNMKTINKNVMYFNHHLNDYDISFEYNDFVDVCNHCDTTLELSNISSESGKNKLCFNCQPINKSPKLNVTNETFNDDILF